MPRCNLTPIDVEYKGYHAVSSGSFSMGMGSVYIIDPNGNLLIHLSLGEKPTEKLLKEYLKPYVDMKEAINGKQEEKSNPSNNG